jgi:hypothetical protein
MARRPAVEQADALVWEGWMSLLTHGTKLISQAPLERMLRVKDIYLTVPSTNNDRELQALLGAPLERQRELIMAAVAYRTLYEAILEQVDPTLHH